MSRFNVIRCSVRPVEGGLWTWNALVDRGAFRFRIGPIVDFDSQEDAECDAFNYMIGSMMPAEPVACVIAPDTSTSLWGQP